MGNIVATFKRFLSNKNTVTILGVLLGIIVLYVGYNYQVKKAINTVSIPYAKKSLNATSEITKDSVGKIEVLQSFVSSSKTIITNINNIVSTEKPYCVKTGTSIPTGGFFYTEQVALCNTISNNVFNDMPDGYRPVSLNVDIHSTYGNSMYPGDYIDLYVKMQSTDGKLIYGRFISKLPILDVRDNKGTSVFATTQTAEPSTLLFAVPSDLYLLLSKAKLLKDKGIELIPVPGNRTYTSTVGETKVTSEYLRSEILKYTSEIPDEIVD